MADAVSRTLGPYGANALLEKKLRVTNDGVSIANEITAEDPIEDLGVRKTKEIASKTNDLVGDGTTTSVTLGDAILDVCSKKIGGGDVIGGISPSTLVKKIEEERQEVEKALIALATPVESKEQLVRSAVVAVEREDLGKMIGEMQWEIGKAGVILTEEVNEDHCSIERMPGMRLDNGLGTTLIMNNEEKQSLELKDCLVIFTNHTLKDLQPVKTILEQIGEQSKASNEEKRVLIIARGFTDQAIQVCMKNIKESSVKIYPINAPYVDQVQVMKDMQAVLGGRFMNAEESALEDMQLSDLGYCASIVAYRYNAVITGKEDEMSEIRVEGRIAELEEKLNGSPSDFEKKLIEARIAQLKNGFALLKVGAVSETERRYIKDKVDDGVNAVRAALQEGTVPGAGLAFKQIADKLPADYLLKGPLASIYTQLMSRAPAGFVIEEWVRDPVKVLRIALENACSIAATFSTVEIAIAASRPNAMDQFIKKLSSVNSEAPAEGGE